MASTPPPEGPLHQCARPDGRLAGSPHRGVAETTHTMTLGSTSGLVAALRQQVRRSLTRYHYENARFFAERLFELEASYHHLLLLAHTYVEAGGDLLAAALQLLALHAPFFPLDARQALSEPFLRRVHTSLSGEQPHSGQQQHHQQPTRLSTRADSVDLLSTDEEASRGPQVEVGREQTSATPAAATVDVVSRWWCQYLFAVCCARKERFREGAKALHELRGISTTLQSAFGPTSLNVQAAEGHDAVNASGEADQRGRRGCGSRLTGVLAALYEQDTLVDFFASMEERLADVDCWLGFCTTRFFQRQDTSEYFFAAVRRDPTLLAAFDSYTQHMREPPSSCIDDLFSDAAFNRAMSTRRSSTFGAGTDAAGCDEERLGTAETIRSPLRRSVRHDPVDARDFNTATRPSGPGPSSSVPSVPSASPVTRTTITTNKSSPLSAFIRQYARVMLFQRTYRGDDVMAALAQLPPSTAATRSHAESAVAAAVGDSDVHHRRSAWVWLQLGLAHFHAGRMEESASAFARAVQEAPWRLDDPALIYYSTALWQLRDESRLGALAQFMVDKVPFSAVTLCVMANTYSLSKEPHDAVVMLERASQVDQTLAYAHCLRGYELLALGQREAASDAFKSALAIDPRHYMSFAGIGERCLRDEQLPEARNCFRLAIAINPLPAIMNRLTATYHRSDATHKELTDALAIYERTIAQHPQNSFAASHQRADVLLRLGRVREAYTALLTLQRQRPTEAVVQVTLARCLQCMGDPQAAIRHYHRAMALDPRREGYVRCALERIAADPTGNGG